MCVNGSPKIFNGILFILWINYSIHKFEVVPPFEQWWWNLARVCFVLLRTWLGCGSLCCRCCLLIGRLLAVLVARATVMYPSARVQVMLIAYYLIMALKPKSSDAGNMKIPKGSNKVKREVQCNKIFWKANHIYTTLVTV